MTMLDSDYGKIISKNLKRIMYDHGKTQSDIAKDLSISKATVSSWVNGSRIPRMDKIDMLCSYFNVSRYDIMEDHKNETEHQYYLNPETARIAQQIYEDPDLHALFDAAADSDPKDMQMAADLLRRLKKTNPDG